MAFKAGDIIFELKGDIKGLNDAMAQASANVRSSFGNISNTVGTAMMGAGAAILGTVGAIGYQAISAAMEVETASQKIVASLGLPSEEAKRFAEMIRQVYGDNFASSLTDAGDAITTVALGLKNVGVTSNEALVGATEKAIALRDAFQVDISESVNAVSGLMQNFGITSEEAFNFITFGMQQGLNASGDFLDSIGEYSTQFANGGATAEQFFSIMESGMQSGMLGTDKAADAFKEFRVRLLDGSKTTAEALQMIGMDINQVTADINAGTMTTADVFGMVIERLAGTNNQTIQLQAGVGLLGTQFEDLGNKTVLAMNIGSTSMADMANSTQSLDEQYKTLGNTWEGMKRKLVLAGEAIGQDLLPQLHDLADALVPVAKGFSEWVSENPGLVSAILEAAAGVGSFLLVGGTLLKFFAEIKAWWILLGGVWTWLAGVLGAIAAAVGIPVWAVVAIIAAAAAAIFYYWDELKSGLIATWEAIKAAWLFLWGPIIDGIIWLKDIGLGVLEKAASLVGLGGGGGGGGQQAVAAPSGGQFASAYGGGGGGAGVSGFGGLSMTFNVFGNNDTEATGRSIAEMVRLELSARGL